MKFTAELAGSDVTVRNLQHTLPGLTGLEEGSDFDIEDKAFTVEWEFDIEAREWGVKSLTWYVTDIKGAFTVVRYAGEGDEIARESIEFDYEGYFDGQADMDIELDECKQIMVSEIEIDFKEGAISVT